MIASFAILFATFHVFLVNADVTVNVNSIPLPVGIQINTEYVFRYDTQGYTNEPSPIYTVVTDDGLLKVAYTDASAAFETMAAKVQVVTVAANFNALSTTVQPVTFTASEVKGLATNNKNWFAIMLRERFNSTYSGITNSKYAPEQNMRLTKATASGTVLWSKTIEDRPAGDGMVGRIHDFGLGDGRLIYGEQIQGRLAAYYKVSTGNTNNWHEGDTLKYFDSDDGTEIVGSGVGWGCSHSMEQRIIFNQQANDFGYVCASDCYPSKGIYWKMSGGKELKSLDANCGGVIKGGLGGLVSYGTKYYVVSTVPPADGTYDTDGTDVLLSVIDNNVITKQYYLTTTRGVYETHSHIARYGSNKLLIGWRESPSKPTLARSGKLPTNYIYKLAVVSLDGVVASVQDITAKAVFGERNDWVSLPNGDVAWVTAWSDTEPKYDYTTPSTKLRVVVIPAPSNDASLCGNGVVDTHAGESCDDTSACCKQCKLQSQCSPPGQCCTSTCMFESVVTVCTRDGSNANNTCGSKPYPATCGSCLQGVCDAISTQITGNTGWCPILASNPCTTQVNYTGNCREQFYKGMEKLPNGTACAVGGSKVCLGGSCVDAQIVYPRFSASSPTLNTLVPAITPPPTTSTSDITPSGSMSLVPRFLIVVFCCLLGVVLG